MARSCGRYLEKDLRTPETGWEDGFPTRGRAPDKHVLQQGVNIIRTMEKRSVYLPWQESRWTPEGAPGSRQRQGIFERYERFESDAKKVIEKTYQKHFGNRSTERGGINNVQVVFRLHGMRGFVFVLVCFTGLLVLQRLGSVSIYQRLLCRSHQSEKCVWGNWKTFMQKHPGQRLYLTSALQGSRKTDWSRRTCRHLCISRSKGYGWFGKKDLMRPIQGRTLQEWVFCETR